LPGFKQYAELPIFYSLGGVYIQASTTEQWGLVVNEAMACGLPVIVSNRCGCVSDLVEEGINGYSYDPYDSSMLEELMFKMASDNCDRVLMRDASSKIIGRWTPETFANNLLQAAEVGMEIQKSNISLLDKIILWMLIQR
jgi:glycosyltransferase involved in cell wall biosynthesis